MPGFFVLLLMQVTIFSSVTALILMAVKQIFKIWMLPYGDQIGETISVINALLSACLGISSIRYTTEQELIEDGNGE